MTNIDVLSMIGFNDHRQKISIKHNTFTDKWDILNHGSTCDVLGNQVLNNGSFLNIATNIINRMPTKVNVRSRLLCAVHGAYGSKYINDKTEAKVQDSLFFQGMVRPFTIGVYGFNWALMASKTHARGVAMIWLLATTNIKFPLKAVFMVPDCKVFYKWMTQMPAIFGEITNYGLIDNDLLISERYIVRRQSDPTGTFVEYLDDVEPIRNTFDLNNDFVYKTSYYDKSVIMALKNDPEREFSFSYGFYY